MGLNWLSARTAVFMHFIHLPEAKKLPQALRPNSARSPNSTDWGKWVVPHTALPPLLAVGLPQIGRRILGPHDVDEKVGAKLKPRQGRYARKNLYMPVIVLRRTNVKGGGTQ